jgi:hypothetical protein
MSWKINKIFEIIGSQHTQEWYFALKAIFVKDLFRYFIHYFDKNPKSKFPILTSFPPLFLSLRVFDSSEIKHTF